MARNQQDDPADFAEGNAASLRRRGNRLGYAEGAARLVQRHTAGAIDAFVTGNRFGNSNVLFSRHGREGLRDALVGGQRMANRLRSLDSLVLNTVAARAASAFKEQRRALGQEQERFTNTARVARGDFEGLTHAHLRDVIAHADRYGGAHAAHIVAAAQGEVVRRGRAARSERDAVGEDRRAENRERHESDIATGSSQTEQHKGERHALLQQQAEERHAHLLNRPRFAHVDGKAVQISGTPGQTRQQHYTAQLALQRKHLAERQAQIMQHTKTHTDRLIGPILTGPKGGKYRMSASGHKHSVNAKGRSLGRVAHP